MAIVSIGRLRG